ncbi:hypothetical protein [Sodalis sp. RH19]|uniref:hypothetical protein n=1 Tax=Sodalis sp. RH19 TaxID=3394334 RepID=UPI0039B62711
MSENKISEAKTIILNQIQGRNDSNSTNSHDNDLGNRNNKIKEKGIAITHMEYQNGAANKRNASLLMKQNSSRKLSFVILMKADIFPINSVNIIKSWRTFEANCYTILDNGLKVNIPGESLCLEVTSLIGIPENEYQIIKIKNGE